MENEFYKPGYLEVFCGPMRSGKTFELINRFSKLKYANIGFKLFSPSLDTRANTITSRNGNSIDSIKIDKANEIITHLDDNDKVIGIDEAQFFDEEIKEIVMRLLLERRNVVIAGLDSDAKRQPFGSMDFFLREADSVKKLAAACEVCQGRGRYTKRLVDDDSTILVGDKEYSARCRQHYLDD
ncbi:MAG: thymidine kinase [Candidatus Woesearchaeota archaeon]